MKRCEDCDELYPPERISYSDDDRVFCDECYLERYRIRFWDSAEARRLEARGDL